VNAATTIFDNHHITETYQETVIHYVPLRVVSNGMEPSDQFIPIEYQEICTREVQADAGVDTLNLQGGIEEDKLWFQQSSSDLLISVIGTNDSARIQDWFTSDYNKVETIETSSGASLEHAAVQNLVSAMAGMPPPASGQLTLSDDQHQQLDTVIAASWQQAG